VLTDFKNVFIIGLSSKFATCRISHHTLSMSLHYLVTFSKSTIAIGLFLMYLTQYHIFVS